MSSSPTPQASSAVGLLACSKEEVRVSLLREGSAVVVGRAPTCELRLEAPSLSRQHARFWLEEGKLWVEDLGARNGLRVQNVLVDKAPCRVGDTIHLGEVVVLIIDGGDAFAQSLVQPYERIVERIEEEVRRSRSARCPTSVLAVQTSGVGSDEHIGHHSSLLARQLRPVDGLGIYGPQAALIVLAETSLDGAAQVARRLHAGSAALRIGVASLPEQASSAAELVSRATEAAQRAPKAGGVTLAERDEPARVSSAPIIVDTSMHELYRLIERVALTEIPILIFGETGVGKELVASAVHQQSRRHKGPLKTVNCAALPETLLESLLFGHERGAFTGAHRGTPGLFEQASGGTLFLDEIGELSAGAQAALLRALETKRILRLGSTREVSVDVRMVAATHRPLAEMVRAGSFREDLYHRLNTFTVHVPPLRERKAEILPLAGHFLAQAAQRWNLPARAFSAACEERLEAHAWPGNVRELRNVVERAAAICVEERIVLDDLPESLRSKADVLRTKTAHESDDASAAPFRARMSTRPSATFAAASDEESSPKPLRRQVQELEERLIREALKQTAGNQGKAAELLHMPRRTLTQRLTQYGIDPRNP